MTPGAAPLPLAGDAAAAAVDADPTAARRGAAFRSLPPALAAIAAFALLVVAGIWITAILLIASERERLFQDAGAELLGAQNAIAAQIGRTIEAAEVLIDDADRWLGASPPGTGLDALARLIAAHQRHAEFPTAIHLFDARSDLVRFGPAGAAEWDNVADQEFIRGLAGKRSGETFVAKQIQTQSAGNRIIPVAARAGPNPFGVATIVTLIPTEPLIEALKDMFVTVPGTFGVLRMDGELLLRHPDPEGFTGRLKIDMEKVILRDGELRHMGMAGGGGAPQAPPVLAAYKLLGRLPLAVYAAFRVERLEARLVPGMRLGLGIAGLLTSAIVLLAGLIALLILRSEREAARVAAALRAVSAVEAAKRQFLTGMSQELRTPLNAIVGYSDVMGGQIFGPLEGRYLTYAKDIQASGRHLLGIVDQLLELVTFGAGQRWRPREPVAFASLADDVIRMVAPLAAKRQVRLAVSPPPDPVVIHSDPTALRKVLINLLANAVNFCRPDAWVDLSWQARQDGLSFVVADQGSGVRPGNLDRVFEPFWQDGNVCVRDAGGVGLGLPVTRRLVERLGGRIETESEPGRGSRFTVTIPGWLVPGEERPATNSELTTEVTKDTKVTT